MKILFTFILVLLLIPLCGCQTFTLSPEQFAAHQKGNADNSPESQAVAVGGTAGYWAVAIAEMFSK